MLKVCDNAPAMKHRLLVELPTVTERHGCFTSTLVYKQEHNVDMRHKPGETPSLDNTFMAHAFLIQVSLYSHVTDLCSGLN